MFSKRITTEEFKEIFSKTLKGLGFKKKGSYYRFENEEALFVLTHQRSSFSSLYYIRGNFFIKPLVKKPEDYSPHEGLTYFWHAEFQDSADVIDLEKLSKNRLLEKLEILQVQLNHVKSNLNQGFIEKNWNFLKKMNLVDSK